MVSEFKDLTPEMQTAVSAMVWDIYIRAVTSNLAFDSVVAGEPDVLTRLKQYAIKAAMVYYGQ